MTMNTSTRAPAIRVQPELSVPLNFMIDEIVPSTSTPSSEPMTKPYPPVSSVPPIATAAIASSSMPIACSGLPDCTALNVYSSEPSEAQNPLIDVHADLRARYRQPHQHRRRLAAADGVDGAAEARVVEHDDTDHDDAERDEDGRRDRGVREHGDALADMYTKNGSRIGIDSIEIT